MEKEFWEKLWSENDIGFHLNEVNPVLKKFGDKLLANCSQGVFLPLCGKTLDLLWFSKRAAQVYGVELSEKAIIQFFEENNLEYTSKPEGDFKVFRSGNISVYCGDVFNFPLDDLDIDAVFDRGALEALPLPMRKKYYDKFNSELKKGSSWLLCAFNNPQELRQNPPFSINGEELTKNLVPKFSIEVLEEHIETTFDIKKIEKSVYLITN